MLNNILKFIIVTVLFLIIDVTWIFFIAGPMFKKMVSKIQSKPMEVNIPFAIVSYLLLSIGTFYFGVYLPNKYNMNTLHTILTGGLFGLLSYGIFDFTNLALFSDYKLGTALIDTLWGGFICSIITIIVNLIPI